jgi:hypothetical protein
MSFFQTFLQDLSQPEYVHVLINPLPVYGLAMGVFALLIAFIARSRRAPSGRTPYAGGKIRHREFRNEPPPQDGMVEHHAVQADS